MGNQVRLDFRHSRPVFGVGIDVRRVDFGVFGGELHDGSLGIPDGIQVLLDALLILGANLRLECRRLRDRRRREHSFSAGPNRSRARRRDGRKLCGITSGGNGLSRPAQLKLRWMLWPKDSWHTPT